MASLPSLLSVTNRLAATSTQELPLIAASLALSLSDCGDVLSSHQNHRSPAGASDAAFLVHRLKTRITSLLQDKSIEGRWTAVILVKATVEAGQWEILRGSEVWVRALLAILSRPDPLSTKKLCVITLTRLFHLTRQYPTLLREITSPSLPTFITTCLNLISFKQIADQTRKLKHNIPLLETVLHALLELLPHHPTIFRPFCSHIHDLVLLLIGSPSVACSFSDSAIYLAQRLLISLHHCAPRNASGEEWVKGCRLTISSIHRTGDHLFRAVLEQWESGGAALGQVSKPTDYSCPVGDEGPDSLGLSGWQGIHAGAERLRGLLQLLSGFILTQTNSTVSIPIGSILHLSSRLTCLTVPSHGGSGDLLHQMQFTAEAGREEQENLYNALPLVHVAVLELLCSIIEIFRVGSISIAQSSLDYAVWIFEAENFNKGIRTATYRVVTAILRIIGPSMTKSDVSSLDPIIRFACSELLPLTSSNNPGEPQNPGARGRVKTNHTANNADSFLDPRLNGSLKAATASVFPGLRTAASSLLPNVLNYLPTEHLSASLRAEIDRTAILTHNESSMMASILNPVQGHNGKRGAPSIMPFLARSYPNELGVESFLRPRMPVLTSATTSSRLDHDGEEEDIQELGTSIGTNLFSKRNGRVDSTIIHQKPLPPLSSSGPGPAYKVDDSATTRNKRSYQDDAENCEQKTLQHAREHEPVISQPKKMCVAADHDPLSQLPPRTSLEGTFAAATTTTLEQDSAVPAKFQNSSDIVTAAPSIPVSNAASSEVVTGDIATAGAGSSDYGAIQPEAKTFPKVDMPTSPGDIDEDSSDDIPMVNIEPDTDENSDDDDSMLDG